MNWQIFSTTGYLGIALAMAAVALWLVHWQRPLRWLPAIALTLTLAATVASRINSKDHVNRIAIDPSERLAEVKAREDAKRQALIDGRSDEVAQVEFAEDDGDEFLDKAGLDETELKYLEATMDGDTPAWKQQKKSRGSAAKDDDSLEGMIGGVEKSEGADVSAIEQADNQPEPIFMSEANMVLANRLDFWNLRASKWLIWIAIAVLILDYLRRANHYQQATWPLPLPSSWLDAMTPTPEVHTRPQPARRDTTAELAWLTRRGDSWICFTDKPAMSQDTIKSLESLKRWPYRLDLMPVDDRLDDDFIFESLWYGRSSFIVDSPDRTKQLLARIVHLLALRSGTRARAPQTVHLVWDCASPVPAATLDAFRHAARGTGVSLFLIHDTSNSS